QTPPPTHVFNPNLPGLTWVDLVFPFFLFAMGASFPLSLSRLQEKGWQKIKIVFWILKRGFLLGTFAICLHHLRPNIINNTSQNTDKWWLGLWGFTLLFLIFARLPKSWFKSAKLLLTISGWILIVLLLAELRYPDGSGFLLERSDIILIVLTNMAVFGSLIWLFTQGNLGLRVGLLGILLGLRLSSTHAGGWVASFWFASPAAWIFRFDYLKYLFIVIPATIVGDLVLEWMERSPLPDPTEDSLKPWTLSRHVIIACLMLTFELVLLVGLQSRWVWQTALTSLVLSGCGWLLIKQPTNSTERFLNKLYLWGCYWLILGLAFEPFQGGIKKDSATYSYFFVTLAMAIFSLILLTIISDRFQQKKLLSFAIYNGQNPMLAYVVFGNLLLPILRLTQLHPAIVEMTQPPWWGFFRGVVYTAMVGYIVTVFSRLKIFWRT
ncbi:MAG: DUF5009 domain-containing protein, partial [Okeania sp. SIO2H7]|nr:DUF5009 domain-containing protein [Okeania sp. SIO2H7]